MNCLPAAYVNQHYGRPQLKGTPAIFGDEKTGGRAAPGVATIRLSNVDAFSLLGAAVETDNVHGPGAYSLQDNTNEFIGTNHDLDAVQFVYQTTNGGTTGSRLHLADRPEPAKLQRDGLRHHQLRKSGLLRRGVRFWSSGAERVGHGCGRCRR